MDQNAILHYQRKLLYEIDAYDLNQLLAKAESVVVLDARSAKAFECEHIIAAINFPHRLMNKESAAERLDFSVEYVTYCDGIGCNASTKGALKLAELGYKVKELIGGLDWWKRDGYLTLSGQLSHHEKLAQVCGCEG